MTGNATSGRVNRMNKPSFAAPAEVRIDSVRKKRIKNDAKSLIKISTIIMLGIFVLIGMRAYCAYEQHANNMLIQENAFIQAEIDSLNSQLSEKTKVTKIETVAMNKYGMVFPTPENVINLGDKKDKDSNLAAAIKSEAYN